MDPIPHRARGKARRPRSTDRRERRTQSEKRNPLAMVATLSLAVIAGVLVWPYLRRAFLTMTAPVWSALPAPEGAPPRPSSTNPGPDERVRLEEAWREALMQPWEDYCAYEEKLRAIERRKFGNYWAAHSIVADRELPDADRKTSNRLAGDLRLATLGVTFYNDFTPRDVERLEAKLSELQAKLRRLRQIQDHRHELLMRHAPGKPKDW